MLGDTAGYWLYAWPSRLYGGGPHDFSVSPSPFGTNWVFELGWTGFGLGLGGLETKGLGTGLDNVTNLYLCHTNLLENIWFISER